MQCPECKQNGINPLSRVGLIFDLNVRCSKCGTEYYLHKGFSFVISLVVQAVTLLSIFYAFVYLDAYIAYTGVLVGLALVGTIALFLPIRKQTGLRFKRNAK